MRSIGELRLANSAWEVWGRNALQEGITLRHVLLRDASDDSSCGVGGAICGIVDPVRSEPGLFTKVLEIND